MDIEKILEMEQERSIYLQWKSDCWRNVALLLVKAIKSNNTSTFKMAIDEFEKVKEMFPYREI